MADLPPLIIDIEDRMAWAAYTSHCAMSGIEEPMVPDYRQFKVERMVWDAVARGVIDAAAQFINEIKEKSVRYDQMVGVVTIEPEDRASHPSWQMLCDHCGMTRIDATTRQLTLCAPPFTVQPHAWTGKHPYERNKVLQPLREAVQKAEGLWRRSKEGPRASTYEGRSETQELYNKYDAAKKVLVEKEQELGLR